MVLVAFSGLIFFSYPPIQDSIKGLNDQTLTYLRYLSLVLKRSKIAILHFDMHPWAPDNLDLSISNRLV